MLNCEYLYQVPMNLWILKFLSKLLANYLYHLKLLS